MRRPTSTPTIPTRSRSAHGVDAIYWRIDWKWAQVRGALISMGWSPEKGHIPYDWAGYNEAMLVVLLALGSPTHPVGESAWNAWSDSYRGAWGRFMGYEHLSFAPLFGHQYSHAWIDFRGIQDATMRERGIDYFENTRRAVYAQRAYAIANPKGFYEYGANIWGFTACDGPGKLREFDRDNRFRHYLDYSARGAGRTATIDDGTIAPTAALSSLPFAPEIVIPAVEEMHARYGKYIYSQYGFVDSFNRSLIATDAEAVRRPHRSGVRLGREGLHRHRPGPDPRDDRQLPQRAGLGRHAQLHAAAARAGARRLQRRLARQHGLIRVPGLASLRRHDSTARRQALRRLAAGASLLTAGRLRPARRSEGAAQLLGDGPRGRGRGRAAAGLQAPAIPSIEVQVQQLPWTAAHEKLLTAYAGGSLPDLCQLGNTWLPELAALDALEPLDARGARRRHRAATTTSPASSTPTGCRRRRRPPVRPAVVRRHAAAVLPHATCCAKPAMPSRRRAGPSGSARCARCASAAGRAATACCCRSTSPTRCSRWRCSRGRCCRRRDAAARSRSPAFRRALGFYTSLFHERPRAGARRQRRSPTSGTSSRAACSRSTSAARGTSASSGAACRASASSDWATAPLPGPDGPGVSTAGGSSLVLFKGSPRKDAAWRLIAFLSEPATMQRFHALTGNLPPRRSAWHAPALAADVPSQAFARQLERVRAAPKIPEWERIFQEMQLAAERVVHGRRASTRRPAQLDASGRRAAREAPLAARADRRGRGNAMRRVGVVGWALAAPALAVIARVLRGAGGLRPRR